MLQSIIKFGDQAVTEEHWTWCHVYLNKREGDYFALAARLRVLFSTRFPTRPHLRFCLAYIQELGLDKFSATSDHLTRAL
ncbi:hypothetical protein HanIR_Chr16g0795551 [Helianthus annuus]|nr:hypothetical protein HanIR_Chr16g0795551 [Helianthus annuus]